MCGILKRKFSNNLSFEKLRFLRHIVKRKNYAYWSPKQGYDFSAKLQQTRNLNKKPFWIAEVNQFAFLNQMVIFPIFLTREIPSVLRDKIILFQTFD